MVLDERSEIVKSWRSDSASGAGYAETCKHSSTGASDGRPNTSDPGLMLFIVDRITSPANLCQFLQQSSSVCNGCGCESGKAKRDDSFDYRGFLECQSGFARGRAMGGDSLQCRYRIDALSIGLRSVDYNAMGTVENRQVYSLSAQSCQRIHEGLCFTMKVHVCQYHAAQLEKFKP